MLCKRLDAGRTPEHLVHLVMCRLDGILTRTHAQEAFLRYDSLVEALARIEYPIDRMTIELKIMPRETQ